ncbi:hypothetical protein [Helicobacter rodentium]|uniref:hypothetical protein n=1 Tax=Helicobacter rodentium TaxID=59617 RepID=UPI0023543DCE|nr:hypothetical protein [Helicobacter rodentium]
MTKGGFSSIPLLPSLRGKAEAIHNVAKQKPLQWNLTSKIPCYRLPQKLKIFSQ